MVRWIVDVVLMVLTQHGKSLTELLDMCAREMAEIRAVGVGVVVLGQGGCLCCWICMYICVYICLYLSRGLAGTRGFNCQAVLIIICELARIWWLVCHDQVFGVDCVGYVCVVGGYDI